jgi:ABC-type Mn2+/Zn2+ transport system ATPase subunit
LQVAAGEQVAVLGPNGAGKSTLFNVVAGILKPQRGEVRVYGRDPRRQSCIGYVPQRSQIDRRFPATVWDVVMMGRTGHIGLFRWPAREDHARVEQALMQVGMQDFATRQIGELSGGQQQRVFVARALAQGATLLLLDEPLTGLDVPSQDKILTVLDELRSQRITIVMATHDLNMAAQHAATLLLLNRRLIAYGTPAAVFTAEILAAAYGGHLHVLRPQDGVTEPLTVLADTCCGHGEIPSPAPAQPRAHSLG